MLRKAREKVLLAAAILILAGIGAALLYEELRTKTVEEQVLEAFEEYVEANAEMDFEELWDRTARSLHQFMGECRTTVLALDPDDPEDAVELERLGRDLGLTQQQAANMSDFEYYERGFRFLLWMEFSEWQRQHDLLDDLDPPQIEVKGDRGYLRFDLDGEWALTVTMYLEDGQWRVFNAHSPDMDYEPLPFESLGRKVSAHLPRGSGGVERIKLVVEVGPEDPSPEMLLALEQALARFECGVVILDASPKLSWGSFVQYHDLLLREHPEVLFLAECPEELPSGIRLNGLPIGDITPTTVLPDPYGRPAVLRILGIHPFIREALEGRLERRNR